MKKALLVFVAIVGVLTAEAVELQCMKCHADILEGDRFCPNCGVRLTNDDEVNEVRMNPPKNVSPVVHVPSGERFSGKSFSAIDRLKGMGRGLLTVLFSPMDLLQGAGYGCGLVNDAVNGGRAVNDPVTAVLGMLFVYPGAALGSFATCADVINGTVDMVSLGYYGDWLYRPDGAHSPTPWFWERNWYDLGERPEFPWITK